MSQVPIVQYSRQDVGANSDFFPARNVTMSALTEATLIVEAGERSGALVQARHALKQKRKLFILESCFQNPSLRWPETFAKQGAIRVADYGDIKRHLAGAPQHDIAPPLCAHRGAQQRCVRSGPRSC